MSVDQPAVVGGAERPLEPGQVLTTTKLQVHALGLTGALMQNITGIAPAITAFFYTTTIVGFTGAISPFAYTIGFVVVLALGSCLVQLREVVSFCRRLLHLREPYARATGGLPHRLGLHALLPHDRRADPRLFRLDPPGRASDQLRDQFPWWAFALIAIPIIAVLGLYGIKLSVRAMVILGALEFLIVLALGLSGLISPGSGRLHREGVRPELRPRAHVHGVRLHAGDRVLGAGAHRMGVGGAPRRGDVEIPAETSP